MIAISCFGQVTTQMPQAVHLLDVDMGDAIGHIDGVILAGGLAVAKAHTAIGAGVRAGKEAVCSCATDRADVFVAFLGVVDRALAEDMGDLRDKVGGRDTEVLGQFHGNLSATHRAFGCVELSVSQCLGIAFAAGKTAGAAVRTRQDGLDVFQTFINRNGEDFRSDDDNNT